MVRSMKPQHRMNASVAFHFVHNFSKIPIEATQRRSKRTKMKSIELYHIIAVALSLPTSSAASTIIRELFDGSCGSDQDCLNAGDCCSQHGYCGTGEEYQFTLPFEPYRRTCTRFYSRSRALKTGQFFFKPDPTTMALRSTPCRRWTPTPRHRQPRHTLGM
jgi:hypothetical protein